MGGTSEKVCNSCGRRVESYAQCSCGFVMCSDCLSSYSPADSGSFFRTILTGSSGGYWLCPRCGRKWKN